MVRFLEMELFLGFTHRVTKHPGNLASNPNTKSRHASQFGKAAAKGICRSTSHIWLN